MKEKYYRRVYQLAIFTIVYNLFEGLISVWFGYSDKTLALFGFGVDSFIEVISGLGILQMLPVGLNLMGMPPEAVLK